MFLTLEDPRARVKGSRDPLGIQPVWSAFGRKIVANLTTVTDSLRGFTVLLLGRYFGERLLREGRIEEEDVLDVFLRIEQVCGYARCLAPQDDHGRSGRILGIERISRRIAEGASSVKIGTTADATILSDQKTYGLWGLFSVSARVSRLLRDGPIGLDQEATEFVENHYLPRLSPVLDSLQRLVENGGPLSVKPPAPILPVLGRILVERPSPAERQFYRTYLCDGTRCDRLEQGRQSNFRRLLESHSDLQQGINRNELDSIRKAARSMDPDLALAIDRVLTLEALLAPCDVVFALLQARHGQSPAEVAATLGDRWGASMPHLDQEAFAEIRASIAGLVGENITEHMAGVHRALLRGDYEAAIRHMLDWNCLVMKSRSAAPWVRLDDHDALDVRYRGIEPKLPAAEALPSLWRNSYFINALKALVAQTAETGTSDGQAP